jgi:hypothetical protein
MKIYYVHLHYYALGVRDNVYGTATGSKLNSLEFKSQWDVIFCSPQGTPSLLYIAYLVFPWGKAVRVWC